MENIQASMFLTVSLSLCKILPQAACTSYTKSSISHTNVLVFMLVSGPHSGPTIVSRILLGTTQLKMRDCPGHFGTVEMHCHHENSTLSQRIQDLLLGPGTVYGGRGPVPAGPREFFFWTYMYFRLRLFADYRVKGQTGCV